MANGDVHRAVALAFGVWRVSARFARAINPTTKTNWEGVGVEPDVKVPAADALTTAEALASKELASRRAKPSS